MSSAIADRVRLSYIEESSFGVTPSGNLTEIRTTGESLRMDTSIAESSEIRPDRQIADTARTSISAAGAINFLLSYAEYDDFMEKSLQSAGWSTENAVITADTTVSIASNIITLGTGSWTNTPAVDSWIEVRGFTGTTTNNGYFKVTAATSTTITVENNTGLLTDDAAGEAVTITELSFIENGTNQDSYSIEREYQDLSTTFAAFRGMTISGFNLSVEAGSLITGSFEFMGVEETSETATIGTGYTASQTNEIMNAIDDVDAFREGGSAVGILGFTMALNNNLRNREQVANLGPISIGAGAVALSGNLRVYFSTATLFNKYLNYTATSLSLLLEDGAGNAYILDIPAVNLSGGQRVAGGQNSDIIAEFDWVAYRDSGENVTIRISKVAA